MTKNYKNVMPLRLKKCFYALLQKHFINPFHSLVTLGTCQQFEINICGFKQQTCRIVLITLAFMELTVPPGFPWCSWRQDIHTQYRWIQVKKQMHHPLQQKNDIEDQISVNLVKVSTISAYFQPLRLLCQTNSSGRNIYFNKITRTII